MEAREGETGPPRVKRCDAARGARGHGEEVLDVAASRRGVDKPVGHVLARGGREGRPGHSWMRPVHGRAPATLPGRLLGKDFRGHGQPIPTRERRRFDKRWRDVPGRRRVQRRRGEWLGLRAGRRLRGRRCLNLDLPFLRVDLVRVRPPVPCVHAGRFLFFDGGPKAARKARPAPLIPLSSSDSKATLTVSYS